MYDCQRRAPWRACCPCGWNLPERETDSPIVISGLLMAHPTREVSFDPLVAIGLIKTTSHHTSHRGVLVNRLKARLGTQSLSPRPWRSHFGGCTTRARPCEREPGSMECLI